MVKRKGYIMLKRLQGKQRTELPFDEIRFIRTNINEFELCLYYEGEKCYSFGKCKIYIDDSLCLVGIKKGMLPVDIKRE